MGQDPVKAAKSAGAGAIGKVLGTAIGGPIGGFIGGALGSIYRWTSNLQRTYETRFIDQKTSCFRL